MFSKIFLGLVLTTAFVPSMYSAESATAEDLFSPAMTKQIVDAMTGKANDFIENIDGFSVEKLQDPTAPDGVLSDDTRSKIDDLLTDEHYSASGNYELLIKQQGLAGVYRVVRFTFNKDATNVEDKITKVQEIALVEIKKSGPEEHAHATAPAVAAVVPAPVESRLHSEEYAHAAAPAHEEERAHQAVNAAPAVAAVVSAPVESRVHTEEHAHATAPAVAAVVPAPVESRLHSEEHAHAAAPAPEPEPEPTKSMSDHLEALFADDAGHSEQHAHQQRAHH